MMASDSRRLCGHKIRIYFRLPRCGTTTADAAPRSSPARSTTSADGARVLQRFFTGNTSRRKRFDDQAELAFGFFPGDRTEGGDDEGDDLVAGRRSDLVEPSQ
jgi:hypothetical protein